MAADSTKSPGGWAHALAICALALLPTSAQGNCYCATTCTAGGSCGAGCGGQCPTGCYQSTGICQSPSGNSCELGDLCGTVNFCQYTTCAGTSCSSPMQKACPAPSGSSAQCQACNWDGGVAWCQLTPPTWHYVAKVGVGCTDGDPCTFDDRCAPDGGCRGTPYACPLGECRSDGGCQGDGGCAYTNKTNGSACGDVCTSGGTCSGGVCSGQGPKCVDPDECSAASCDGGNCFFVPRSGMQCDGGICEGRVCVPTDAGAQGDAGSSSDGGSAEDGGADGQDGGSPDAGGKSADGGDAPNPDPRLVNGCGCSGGPGCWLLLLWPSAAVFGRRRRSPSPGATWG
ncbi:MAG: hypothetical protein HYZ28_04625 [Myxococcales bacterium]|nr:hypothetical protein [Myxococcales bacterium]